MKEDRKRRREVGVDATGRMVGGGGGGGEDAMGRKVGG